MSYFRDNIEKMAGYVPGFQPKTADVVKLNTNENPYPPSPAVLAAIRQYHALNSCGDILTLWATHFERRPANSTASALNTSCAQMAAMNF